MLLGRPPSKIHHQIFSAMKKNFIPQLLVLFVFAGFALLSSCTKDDKLARSESLSNNADFSFSSAGEYDAGSGYDPYGTAGEGYNEYQENEFVNVSDEPISTFSIDADGASYSNTRRYLIRENKLPPRGAIRTEEFINYFNYNYEDAGNGHPITLNGEISDCPWTSGNKLLRVGIKGRDIPFQQLPGANFVFLIDVSGSMSTPDKLELLKEGFKIFTDEMRDFDKIAIVTYSGSAGVVLPSTFGSEKAVIKEAIDKLGAGGSTAGAEGIITAYEIAEANFIEGGNNRVILGSDGDFNVGVTSQEALVELIEEKRETGIFLTILGVGTGNLQDGRMEQIANNGNGNYEYLDNIEQAKKVFVQEFNKFYTVAKDVKIQIEFNPNVVSEYRLIGYENRLLETEDFEDDTKDAGEIGSNQTITALYEIVPVILPLNSGPTVTVDFRYKNPDEDTSIPLTLDIVDELNSFNQASENMRFAATAAGFGMLLWESEYSGELTYDMLINWAQQSQTYDPFGYRAEIVELLNIAKGL